MILNKSHWSSASLMNNEYEILWNINQYLKVTSSFGCYKVASDYINKESF